MLDDIALFVRVVASGGLNKAADQLGLPPATVTRRLQRLERQIGSKLLHRSTRRFDLTADGQKLMDECAFLVDSLVERAEDLRQSRQTLSGAIRVMAPVSMTIGVLQGIWTGFLDAYPDVTIEFVLNNSVEDFHASKADFAIRAGSVTDEGVQSQKIGQVRTVLAASPDYVRRMGAPAHPDDLVNHQFIVGFALQHWRLFNSETQQRTVFQINNPRVVVNEFSLVRRFCLDGFGLALFPITELRDVLETGALQRVLPEWQGVTRDIHLAWGRDVIPTVRARRLMEHIRTEVQNIPVLQGQMA